LLPSKEEEKERRRGCEDDERWRGEERIRIGGTDEKET
jgi:hypothetical protein